MSADIVVAGVGELPQGKSEAHTPMELHARLVELALADAGLTLQDIDAVLTVSPRSDPYLVHAAALAEFLGLAPAVAWTLEAGGAAPAAMVATARGLIEAGTAKAVLVVAADLPASAVTRDNYVQKLAEAGPLHPEYEKPYAPSVPSLFANVARAHMERFGTSEEHLAAVAVQNRAAACKHPNAHFRAPISTADHRSSRLIADPLRLLDCAPVSDGGAALVVTRRDSLGPDARQRAVRVVGQGFATGQMHLSAANGAPDFTSFSAGAALERALAQTNRRRSDIALALVYDCFTIAMLVNLEDLGFAPAGQAGPAWLDGRFSPEGELPVNTHGGLLSHGHPARAGGISHVVEAVAQLRGEAGARQVGRRGLAMVHGMSGVFAGHGVLLLEAA